MATLYGERADPAVSKRRGVSEFASGALFGIALFSSGVYATSIVKSQFTFASNAMLTVMMGASASSSIVQDIEDRLKILPKRYHSPENLGLFEYDGHVIGGALIGIGMSLTGSCPGTSLVQAGTGTAHGILVIAGGVLGAMVYLRARPHLAESQARLRRLDESIPTAETHLSSKSLDMATALGISSFVLLLIWVPMCLAVMQVAFAKDESVRQIPQAGLVSPAFGGLMIGFAQLATTILAGHTIGASAAYEDVARWFSNKIKPQSNSKLESSSILTPSVIFSGGVITSAAILSHFLQGTAAFSGRSSGPIDSVLAAQAVAGGAVMVFGARLARGCTSGHGISGLARFSLTSLVTTAAMFSAGIMTASVWPY